MIEARDFSPFGLGTWRMGGGSEPDYSKDELYEGIIRESLRKGINVIDTAEMYGGGHTEEIVGKAMGDFHREDIFLITKAWPSSYGDLRGAVERSLERLNTDYVDLYLLHWPDEKYDLKELIGQMIRLMEEKYTRYIGVSNFNLELLRKAQELSGGKIFSDQIEVNISNQRMFNEIREFCTSSHILPVAYSPLNRNRMPENTRIASKIQKSGLSVSEYSLIYTIAIGAYPIPKFSSIKHLDDLLGAINMYRNGKIRIF